VSGYSGDTGDALAAAQQGVWNANGMMFSTPDSDNDICACNCAVSTGAGWWYGWCSTSLINNNGDVLWSITHLNADVQNTRMLVKVTYTVIE